MRPCGMTACRTLKNFQVSFDGARPSPILEAIKQASLPSKKAIACRQAALYSVGHADRIERIEKAVCKRPVLIDEFKNGRIAREHHRGAG